MYCVGRFTHILKNYGTLIFMVPLFVGGFTVDFRPAEQ